MIARIVGIACGLMGSCMASKALADDVLSNSIRLGAYYVTYHTTADDITGPYVPPHESTSTSAPSWWSTSCAGTSMPAIF